MNFTEIIVMTWSHLSSSFLLVSHPAVGMGSSVNHVYPKIYHAYKNGLSVTQEHSVMGGQCITT